MALASIAGNWLVAQVSKNIGDAAGAGGDEHAARPTNNIDAVKCSRAKKAGRKCPAKMVQAKTLKRHHHPGWSDGKG